MAYFSNGSEGMALDDLCDKCIHGFDTEKNCNRQKDNCAVWLLQFMWNYDQHEREKHGSITIEKRNAKVNYPIGELTREAVVKKMALDILLPQTEETLCSMFVEIPAKESETACTPTSPSGGEAV